MTEEMLEGHRTRVRQGIAILRAALDTLELDLAEGLVDRAGAQTITISACTLAMNVARLEMLEERISSRRPTGSEPPTT